MWDNLLHKRLRDTCAYLWEDSRDCRRLVADSLINSSRINWDEPPALRWQSVIMECEKQGTLHKLCPVLLAEYPENVHLREAVSPWMDNTSGGIAKKPEKKVPIEIPIELADDVDEIPITLQSIRADLAYLAKDIAEIKRWRQEIAVMAAKNMSGEKDTESSMRVSLPDKKTGS